MHISINLNPYAVLKFLKNLKIESLWSYLKKPIFKKMRTNGDVIVKYVVLVSANGVFERTIYTKKILCQQQKHSLKIFNKSSTFFI